MPKNITIHEKNIFVAKNSWELDPEIIDLYITGNVFGGDGVAKIANAFKTNTTLKRLILSGCNVEQIGLDSFLEVLKNNDTLEVLHIEYNIPLNNNSILKLIDMIRYNKGLRKIILKDIQANFTLQILMDISAAIVRNSTLSEFKIKMSNQRICLRDSMMLHSFNVAIDEALQRNKVINYSLAQRCSEIITQNKIEIPDSYPKILIEQNSTYYKYK